MDTGLKPRQFAFSHLKKWIEDYRWCTAISRSLSHPWNHCNYCMLVMLWLDLCYFSLLCIDNKIFMVKRDWKLISEKPKKTTWCFVRAKQQRFNTVSIDLLSSWVRFSIWFTCSTSEFCKIMSEMGKKWIKETTCFTRYQDYFCSNRINILLLNKKVKLTWV